jgi:bifunctional non-homologous end joining protein LigD
MLASIGTSIPTTAGWTFEPKYDGVRVLAFASGSSVRLITRNWQGTSRTNSPRSLPAFERIALRRKRPFVLDGEIVAFAGDAPARFRPSRVECIFREKRTSLVRRQPPPSALVAFDLLVDGDVVLLDQPWDDTTKRLERFVGKRPPKGVRLGESGPGDGEKLLARARRDDWEGIIAKRIDSSSSPALDPATWLKLKVEFRQEFVVGGYTEPRNTREHLGRHPPRLLRRRRSRVRRAHGWWLHARDPGGDGETPRTPRAKVVRRFPLPSARTKRRTGSGPKSWWK